MAEPGDETTQALGTLGEHPGWPARKLILLIAIPTIDQVPTRDLEDSSPLEQLMVRWL